MSDRLDKRDMKDKRDKDAMDKLGTLEWLGSADNWVSMALTDLEADNRAVGGHQRPQSLQLHHLDFQRL